MQPTAKISRRSAGKSVPQSARRQTQSCHCASVLEVTVARLPRRGLAKLRGTTMTIRDPETNFEELWKTFHHRYPFFALRNVDWAMSV